MMSLILQFSTKKIGTRKINDGRRFAEIEVQKTCALYFVIDWQDIQGRPTVYQNVQIWRTKI